MKKQDIPKLFGVILVTLGFLGFIFIHVSDSQLVREVSALPIVALLLLVYLLTLVFIYIKPRARGRILFRSFGFSSLIMIPLEALAQEIYSSTFFYYIVEELTPMPVRGFLILGILLAGQWVVFIILYFIGLIFWNKNYSKSEIAKI